MTIHYVIEHMEPDESSTVPEWVALEYSHMLQVTSPSSHVHFTSLSAASAPSLPTIIASNPSAQAKLHVTTKPIMELLESGELPIPKSRVCLLDPRAEKEISPEDAQLFDVYLFGGILGDDPPRDRTGELRALGFAGRRLGPIQLTTDTAVLCTKLVVDDGIRLDDIEYVDHPTITFSSHESVEMPFRYVKDKKGEPTLPPGMKALLEKDLDKSFEF